MRPIGWDGEELVSQSPSVGGPQTSDPVNPTFALVSPSLLEGRLRGNTQGRSLRPRAGSNVVCPAGCRQGLGIGQLRHERGADGC
jgi:hypothetical protein